MIVFTDSSNVDVIRQPMMIINRSLVMMLMSVGMYEPFLVGPYVRKVRKDPLQAEFTCFLEEFERHNVVFSRGSSSAVLHNYYFIRISPLETDFLTLNYVREISWIEFSSVSCELIGHLRKTGRHDFP